MELLLAANLNDIAINLPDILFLTCDPLRGLKWITSHHCDAETLTEDLVPFRKTGGSSRDRFPK